MPEQTPPGGAGTAPAEPENKLFTQEDVDRIVAERLRRERQRAEKAVRDEYESRIAELETTAREAREAQGEVASLKADLQTASKRALIADRVLARGAPLPAAYLSQIDGDDEAAIDAAIEAAEDQWAADLRNYGGKATDVGSPSNPASAKAPTTPVVDADLAERMRQGDPEAFKQYAAVRNSR
jgi:hypothetical protein